MSAHIVPPRIYLMNVMGLAALMTATILAAYYVPAGTFGAGVAIAIAVAKASLVVLFFMNVFYSSKLTKIFVAGAFFWLIILFGLIIIDYLSRTWVTPGVAW